MSNLVLLIMKNLLLFNNIIHLHWGACTKTTTTIYQSHLSRVTSFPPGAVWKTRKVCVKCRPWMETCARLFYCVNLYCCFYVLYWKWLLPLVLVIISYVLLYVRGVVRLVVVSLQANHTQHIQKFYFIIDKRTRVFTKHFFNCFSWFFQDLLLGVSFLFWSTGW